MLKEEYTNPAERNTLYEQLKREQVEVYNKRREIFKQLENIGADRIKKSTIEKMLESIKELNEVAQGKYDKLLEALLAQHNLLENKLKTIKEELKEKLVDFNAELEEGLTVEGILEGIIFYQYVIYCQR